MPDWDMIVIGSGAGGGTFAYACATAGRSVLVLERGSKYFLRQAQHDEQEMLIDKGPYEPRPVWMNGLPRRLYIGAVLGGGTSLYGAALLRPSEDDFRPGRHYGARIPREIWDWPISYDALEPFYTEAEKLYAVSGPDNDDFGPLHKPRHGYPRPPLPLGAINRQIIDANRARGLKPFRLPLAVDFASCLQCGVCPGYICLNGSRQSSGHLLHRAIARGSRLELLTGVEAEHLEWDGTGKVVGVHVRDVSTGQAQIHRAKMYALAAGAIGSPVVLLRSGITRPLIGRNYMMHLSPIAFGLFRRRTGADESFIKQLGFTDFYYGTPSYRHKLGLIQSLPVPGPKMIAKAASRSLPQSIIAPLRRRMVPLVGIVEDLPNPTNRVRLGRGNRIELRHEFGAYDIERGQKFGLFMRRILKNAGAACSWVKRFPSEEHVAHQCGTLRFGKDPAHAVVDPECRLFGSPNLFVVDGSVFPTSLGVGPALTIMANALRVAKIAVQAL
jgi:choline dehydrogenase-like flavoprotein